MGQIERKKNLKTPPRERMSKSFGQNFKTDTASTSEVVRRVSVHDTIIGYIKECVRNMLAMKENTSCASLKSNGIDTKELVRDTKGKFLPQFCKCNDSTGTLKRRAIK